MLGHYCLVSSHFLLRDFETALKYLDIIKVIIFFCCGLLIVSLISVHGYHLVDHTKLTTLHYRQVRGDMIEVYKIVSGQYDSAITPILIISDKHKTRRNDLRLQKSRLKYDMHKFCFTERVVDQWNSLPN